MDEKTLFEKMKSYLFEHKGYITGYFSSNHCMECSNLKCEIVDIDFTNSGRLIVTSECPNCKTRMHFDFAIKHDSTSWSPSGKE